MIQILIVDDERGTREVLAKFLRADYEARLGDVGKDRHALRRADRVRHSRGIRLQCHLVDKVCRHLDTLHVKRSLRRVSLIDKYNGEYRHYYEAEKSDKFFHFIFPLSCLLVIVLLRKEEGGDGNLPSDVAVKLPYQPIFRIDGKKGSAPCGDGGGLLPFRNIIKYYLGAFLTRLLSALMSGVTRLSVAGFFSAFAAEISRPQ